MFFSCNFKFLCLFVWLVKLASRVELHDMANFYLLLAYFVYCVNGTILNLNYLISSHNFRIIFHALLIVTKTTKLIAIANVDVDC